MVAHTTEPKTGNFIDSTAAATAKIVSPEKGVDNNNHSDHDDVVSVTNTVTTDDEEDDNSTGTPPVNNKDDNECESKMTTNSHTKGYDSAEEKIPDDGDDVMPVPTNKAAMVTPEKPRLEEDDSPETRTAKKMATIVVTPQAAVPEYVERNRVTIKDHKGFLGLYTGRLRVVSSSPAASRDQKEDDKDAENSDEKTDDKTDNDTNTKKEEEEKEDDEILIPDGYGRMEYTNHPVVSVYNGDWQNGAWHGQGQARVVNGDSYAGEHVKGMRHGSGTYRWADGREYAGMFHHDVRHGQGSYQWPCGASYAGSYAKGIRTGYGRYLDPKNGVSYTGDWKDGKYHGYGVLTIAAVVKQQQESNDATKEGEMETAPKRIYRGHFDNGKAHGHGVEVNPDGTICHEGEWINGEPVLSQNQSNNSHAAVEPKKESEFVVVENETVRDANGVMGTYRGILHRESRLPHGSGTLRYDAASQLRRKQNTNPDDCLDYYEGCFDMGRYHGQGRLYWKNGDSYDGEYVEGLRQGQGVYRWSDGRHYKGDFYEDLRHGVGKFIYGKNKDADWYEGEFVKGRREGKGRFIFTDGSVYHGEWKEGVYHGQGILKSNSQDGGTTYKGNFNHGLAHGWGKEIKADGTLLYEGKWIHGETEPEAIRKAEEAKIRLANQATLRQPRRDQESMTAQGGPPEPDCEAVVDLDVVDAEGNQGQYTGLVLVKNQKPHGVGRMVYMDGRRIHEGFWKDGMKDGHGRCHFVQQGDFHEGEYKNNVRHGPGTYKWKDGRVFDGSYLHDLRNGPGVFTYPNGERYEGNFYRGEKHGFGKFEFRGGFYEGEWQAGRYHGKGRLTVRGEILDGYFRDGEFASVDEIPVVKEEELHNVDLNEASGDDGAANEQE